MREYLKEKELREPEVKYYLRNGWKRLRTPKFTRGRGTKWLVKPLSGRESPEHSFFVWVIRDELKSRDVEKVRIYPVKKPDLVFPESGNYAFEVETGKRSSAKRVRKKAERLNKKYEDWWFFLTDSRKRSKYEKFKKPVIVRTQLQDFVKRISRTHL